MSHCRLLIAVLLLVALSVSARAADTLVRTPAELAAAVEAAQPGDAVVLAEGVWRDADLAFTGEGTAAAPITLRAQTPGRTVLSGTSRLRLSGRWLVVDGLVFRDGGRADSAVIEFRTHSSRHAYDSRVTNCAILDYNAPDDGGDPKWVSLYGQRNRLDHCRIEGKTSSGTTVVVWVGPEPDRHRIDHNHFGPRQRLGENGGETIRVGTSDVSLRDSGTVVENNLFEGCDGEIEIISNKSGANIYRGNAFFGCSGSLTLRHGNGCVVEGNWFLGRGKSGSGGVRVIGENHRIVNNYFEGLRGTGARSAISLESAIPDSPLSGYLQVNNVRIAFNTFVDCASTFVIGTGAGGRGRSLPPANCVIANNAARTEGILLTYEAEPLNLRFEGNLFYGPWSYPKTAGITIAEPGLVKGPDGLWRLGPGSPAAGAAQGSWPEVDRDFDGQPRSVPKDVGCDELSTAPVQQRILTYADVGPTWSR